MYRIFICIPAFNGESLVYVLVSLVYNWLVAICMVTYEL